MNQMFVYSSSDIIDLVVADLTKKKAIATGKVYNVTVDLRGRMGEKPDLIFDFQEKK